MPEDSWRVASLQSKVETPKKLVLIPIKECVSTRVDGLLTENESKQETSRVSFFHIVFPVVPSEGAPHS